MNTRWAIKTRSGMFVTYFTAAFNHHSSITIHNWAGNATFDTRESARTIITQMQKNGFEIAGMRPVRVIQQLEEVMA